MFVIYFLSERKTHPQYNDGSSRKLLIAQLVLLASGASTLTAAATGAVVFTGKTCVVRHATASAIHLTPATTASKGFDRVAP